MRQLIIRLAFLMAIIMTTTALSAIAVDIEYKNYKSTNTVMGYFEISFDRSKMEIRVFDDEDNPTSTSVYRRLDIDVRNEKVYDGEEVLMDDDALYVDSYRLEWDQVHDIRVSERGSRTVLTFKKEQSDNDAAARRRSRSIIEYDRDVTVDDDEFVRGVIFTVLGDIHLSGEANRDVISLFGNIRLTGDAVARGDLAVMQGRIYVSGAATVYGEILENKDSQRIKRKRRGRRGRFYRHARESSFDAGFIYNRVDGAHLWGKYEFTDRDSLLPTVTVRGGYAFNSERWRYEASIEQSLLRDMPLTVGVGLHRRLASDDDWLLSARENTAFALLAHEDFKDYYEAEGGSAWIRFKPVKNLKFETRYQYDETKWLEGSRNLWSVFGGDKRFDQNFATVEDSIRTAGIMEIDSTKIGSLHFGLEYDDRDQNPAFAHDGWLLSADLEWSNHDFTSDFDYRRYTIAATRYQRLNRRAMYILGVRYGGSDGYLPMHKRFYLGGLGTLRGYSHKEFMGTKFWMANTEYRFELPGSDLGFGLIYDVAQIANETKLTKNTEVLHSLGVAVYIWDEFSVSLSKRLDRSVDNDPKFYVRLTSGF